MDKAAALAGIPGIDLMKRAGKALSLEILRYTPGKRIGLFCGAGNNGGDALIAANYLKQFGMFPEVVFCTDQNRLHGDALLAYQALDPEIPCHSEFPSVDYDLIVDGIIGTGLDRDITGELAEMIHRINASGSLVFSVDIPSGIDGLTGTVHGTAVHADYTVTMAVWKPGLIYEPGRSMAGQIICADIGLKVSEEQWLDLDEQWVAAHLPQRPADSHKGHYGHLAVLAGSAGMTGAGALCSAAALRTGAGLVSWKMRGTSISACRCLNEIMVSPLGEDDTAVEAFLERKTAAAIGPGLGRAATILVENALKSGLPVVLDADALNALEGQPDVLAGFRGIMTPHPAEAARLLSADISTVLRDPPGTATRLSQVSGFVTVLKGAVTTIAAPDGRIALNAAGNPGMATAGSGDVLTGVIGGLLAQGLNLWEAACCGVWIHASAGDMAAENGQDGLIASDIIRALPSVLKKLRET